MRTGQPRLDRIGHDDDGVVVDGLVDDLPRVEVRRVAILRFVLTRTLVVVVLYNQITLILEKEERKKKGKNVKFETIIKTKTIKQYNKKNKVKNSNLRKRMNKTKKNNK